MLAGAYQGFRVVYENKNTNDLLEFYVERDEGEIQHVVDDLEKLNTATENLTLIPMLTECTKKEGVYRWCPFASRCPKADFQDLRRSPPPGSHVQFGERLTSVPLPGPPLMSPPSSPSPPPIWDAPSDGVDPPIESPYLGLMECAVAYYSRAQEIDALIHEGQGTGAVKKNDPYYRVRTGPLRAFIEAARKHCDRAYVGSPRKT